MIGIEFQGPEVFDTGWARRIINSLKGYELKLMLSGTMGRTAVLDSHMEKEIEILDIEQSEVLAELERIGSERILIVCYSKSTECAHVDAGLMLVKSGVKTPTIKLDCNSRTMTRWNSGDNELLKEFEKLGFREVKSPTVEKVWRGGDKTFRRIHAVSPGEFVFVEGMVVGKAISKDVIVVCEKGRIIEIKGVKLKRGVLEKFGKVNLKKLDLGSGTSLRRTYNEPRIMKKRKGEWVVFVDHRGCDIYKLVEDVNGIVTIGDDTTSIVGDIAYRFQIPIIGIIDGDRDGLLEKTHVMKGSMILKVKNDDDFGKNIFQEVFKGKEKVKGSFESVKKILRLL